MNELLNFLKSLKSKGFATKAEKAKANEMFSKLKEADQAAVADQVEEATDLPEENPNPETEGEEEEIQKMLNGLLRKSKSEISDDLRAELKTFVEEHLSLKAKKAGIYHPEVATEQRAKMSNHLRELAKALYNNDTAKLKEMTTDASGSPYAGYTVDSELSAEIRHLTTQYGVARREMMTIQLSKNSYKANDLATDLTVYWVDEGSAISSTQVVLGQETLSLKKLGAIVTMTSELLEDTEIDFVSFIASRVAEGFAQAEDEAFFKGDGTSTYGSFTGLLEASDVNEVVMTGTTFASMDADDLIDMVDATPAGALANAKFYMHRTIMSIVRKLKDSQNQYIYQAPSESGPSTIWGYPNVLVEAMPTKSDTAADTSFVLFGDLKKACIFGYKGAIKASRFNSGVVRNVAGNADINLITTDREAVRFTERVGYIRIIPTAVTKLTTAAASA